MLLIVTQLDGYMYSFENILSTIILKKKLVYMNTISETVYILMHETVLPKSWTEQMKNAEA